VLQVITSASSFDEGPTAAKVRKPKKGKKTRQGVEASVDEKEAMVSVGYSSAASRSTSTFYLIYLLTYILFFMPVSHGHI